jgi:hypothetical protein
MHEGKQLHKGYGGDQINTEPSLHITHGNFLAIIDQVSISVLDRSVESDENVNTKQNVHNAIHHSVNETQVNTETNLWKVEKENIIVIIVIKLRH